MRTVSALVLSLVGAIYVPYLPQECWSHLGRFNGRAKGRRCGERVRGGDVEATGVLVKSQSKERQ